MNTPLTNAEEGAAPAPTSTFRLLAIIPALNEAESIAAVIAEIREHLPNAIALVIDDGSTDETATRALAAGARVARMPFNIGIGGAMQTGFRIAADEGFDVAVQIDGDGQHPAAEVTALLQTLASTEANYVIGSRFTGPDRTYRPPIGRRGGIAVYAWLVSRLVRQPITDATSGLRAADRRTIHLFAEHYPHDYPEVEAIVLAKRNGLRITEVPVVMRPRSSGRSSITPIRSLYYMVKVTLAVLVQFLGRNPTAEDSK